LSPAKEDQAGQGATMNAEEKKETLIKHS
jgi:hypothetical protein